MARKQARPPATKEVTLKPPAEHVAIGCTWLATADSDHIARNHAPHLARYIAVETAPALASTLGVGTGRYKASKEPANACIL